ncbi:hypothetical protein ACHQM5_004041 [Ranunculus cassubicifolius]
MAKRAVLVGCNYPGTKAALKGCINDVTRMRSCLIERFGFEDEDITMLIDTDDSYTQPTGINIRQALSDLVQSAESGDVLFFQYSGHGTRVPAETGDDDDTGFDECIYPTDGNLITDDDIREFVDQVPEGCRITIVSDSCHSGGLIDEAEEQIGDSHIEENDEEVEEYNDQEEKGEQSDIPGQKSRSLPLSTLIEILKQKTGKDDVNVGNLRSALFDVFGEDASPKVKKFMSFIFTESEDAEGEQEFSKREVFAGSTKQELPDSGILISGCQTDQTSADMPPDDNGSEAYGALSNAIQTVLAESNEPITNRELVLKVREIMKQEGLTQEPGLYCSDEHADEPFVC